MAYYFFMGEKMLPVAPGKLSVKINNSNKTINLINDGEVNLLKNAALTEIAFEVLLPNNEYPFADYNSFSMDFAESYLSDFKTLKLSKDPFQFIVTRMTNDWTFLFDTNITVALEDYEIIEDANNGTDVVASIRLKQYKPYGTKTATIKTNADGTKTAVVDETRLTTKPVPNTAKIMKNQTLLQLVKKNFGNTKMFNQIKKLNGITTPNNMPAGTVLRLVK